MADVSTLGLKVEAVSVDRAADSLDRLSQSADGAEKSAKRLGQGADKAGKQAKSANQEAKRSTDDLGKSYDRTGISIATVAKRLVSFAAAAAAIRSGLRTLTEFETGMSNVAAITRATDAELDQLRSTARGLGAATEYTAGQAADALGFLGLAGFTAAESIKAIPQVLDLATASGMDLAATADTMSNIMSAFAIEAGNAAAASDVLAAASSRSNTSVAQLGDAMSYVGPVASALGVSIGDTAAAIGVLSDAGIQGSSAGTGLRRVMSSLANPTKAAADELSSLGVSLEDVNPATNELASIIDILARSGMDAAQALTIFGDRGGPAILALTANTGRVRELTDEMKNVEGEATRMASTMRDNLSSDAKGLQSSLEDLALTIGEALNPTLRYGTQALTGFSRGLNILLGGDSDRVLTNLTKNSTLAGAALRDANEALEASVRAGDAFTKNLQQMERAGMPQDVIDSYRELGESVTSNIIAAQQAVADARLRDEIAKLEVTLLGANRELERLQNEGGGYYAIRDQARLVESLNSRLNELTGQLGDAADGVNVLVDEFERNDSVLDSVSRKTEDYRSTLTSMLADLTQQADTFGMTEVKALEYRLTLGDLSEAVSHLGAEGASLSASLIEQQQRLQDVTQAAKEAEEAQRELDRARQEAEREQTRTNDAAARVIESLRTEEEAIQESYDRRRELILASTIATEQEKAQALTRLEAETAEALLEINGSYWERYLASAQENLTSFDELTQNVIENMTTQFGNAFEKMVFDSESLGDSVRGLAEGMARSVVNALGQMAAQWLAYQAVQLLVGRTTQASAASTLAANATATSLQAGLAAFASTAAIPIVGPALAPAAMAAALSATAPVAASVGTVALAGMAHDGIDSIPQTGTWLLEKGERVTTAETSARMDSVLERIDSRMRSDRTLGPPPANTGGQEPPNVVLNIHNAPEGTRVEQRQLDRDFIIDVMLEDGASGGKYSEFGQRRFGWKRQGS